MEQNTTSQAAQKQGVKKKKSIKQKLLAFLKLAAPYLILCAIYGTLMLIFGPKESNSMELSIDVGTITLPGIGAVSWSVFVGGVILLLCIVVLLCLNLFYYRGMTENPKKLQNYLQLFVTTYDKMATNRLGETIGREIAPYLFALTVYIGLGCCIELFGLTAMTADINTTLALGICTFIMINYITIRHRGLKYRAQSYLKPMAAVAPVKLLSDLAVPVSLACRLYGNVLAGMIVMELIYSVTTILIPPLLSLYFSVFHTAIQVYIFVFLSLSYVGEALD